MGACVCKGQAEGGEDAYQRRQAPPAPAQSSSTPHASVHHQRLANIGLDIKDLIMETLTVIRTLVNNEQEPPAAMLKLNLIADKEQGWLLIVESLIELVPVHNPLGPAVITLFLDESPLPTKETVGKLLFFLSLEDPSSTGARAPSWHRNVAIVLGCIAEKLAGPNSVATFKPSTLHYLIRNLSTDRLPNVILFSLIALEKYAQTSENKVTINEALQSMDTHPLLALEAWLDHENFEKRQVGFCAQWSLDNLFLKPGRGLSFERCGEEVGRLGAMLNHEDVSEYLKIAASGLEARCDVSSFESVRCTFEATADSWYYEAEILTPGIMQIGWATKDSKFLNHEGYGIGDDEFSVAYDGCRQLIWHNAASKAHSHPPWKPGDIVGSTLNVNKGRVEFSLNGERLPENAVQVVLPKGSGYFAAASFMSFQQCKFNFGQTPFRFPPPDLVRRGQGHQGVKCFHDYGTLTDQQKTILPRYSFPPPDLVRRGQGHQGVKCFHDYGTLTDQQKTILPRYSFPPPDLVRRGQGHQGVKCFHDYGTLTDQQKTILPRYSFPPPDLVRRGQGHQGVKCFHDYGTLTDQQKTILPRYSFPPPDLVRRWQGHQGVKCFHDYGTLTDQQKTILPRYSFPPPDLVRRGQGHQGVKCFHDYGTLTDQQKTILPRYSFPPPDLVRRGQGHQGVKCFHDYGTLTDQQKTSLPRYSFPPPDLVRRWQGHQGVKCFHDYGTLTDQQKTILPRYSFPPPDLVRRGQGHQGVKCFHDYGTLTDQQKTILPRYSFPPPDLVRRGQGHQGVKCFHDYGTLTDQQKTILPRRKLELLRAVSVEEDSCSLCVGRAATVRLGPCGHSGFCSTCALVLESCPLCRAPILDRHQDSS